NTNNKLEITASNETASVLAFIAQRPEGQTTVGNADARKMLNDVSSLPEVYTLKPTANGSIAVLGANIIPAGEALIPVGLFTSHTGAMSLTFKGMDSYENTTITLIDNATDNKEIDLTGLSSYRYDFDFEPATAGNEILPVEDRFAIRFAPSTPTGVHTPSVSALVYSKNQSIHIVSDASNLIKQIQIYNAQGILVHTGDQLNTSSYIVDYPANAGVCIVKVITKQGIKNVKLIK
ncbi:MAG: T9SS type A sorting domain-containing protein, partial [Dysgonamonadaceae bacterium]|nr:T9SS type A sorting domain-containing protein [Dysgonamonadaceae bacterium]